MVLNLISLHKGRHAHADRVYVCVCMHPPEHQNQPIFTKFDIATNRNNMADV
jgi:hypothetical protein